MKDFTLPKDHKPGMRVPKGGSMCANCEYLKDRDKGLCGNAHFIAWNGSDKIPGKIDEYCSDWFEPAKGAIEDAKSDGTPMKKHKFSHTKVEIHDDGSATVHHVHEEGEHKDVKHAVADLDALHDSMEDHLNPEEAENSAE